MTDYKQKINTLIGNLRTEMQWLFDEVYGQAYEKGYAVGCDRGYEEGSIYCKEHCPHEAKIEQEPCEMTAEEYRQRMIQAFHNADTDELIAICVLPTEKEFEHLEWLLKNHYKKEPCEDAISRENAIIRISWDFPTLEISKVKESLNKLPSVNPQPKTGYWIPVSERLPKIAGIYRVTRYYPNNVMNPNYLVDACCFDGSNTWYDDNRINYDRAYADNVIAWQENPEPYKVEPQERSDNE